MKTIPTHDSEIVRGLSALNWSVGPQIISASTGGASFALTFPGTRRVTLRVDTSALAGLEPGRYPVVGWSVGGGARRVRQLCPGETAFPLAEDASDPEVDFYVAGFSPFEDRYEGEHARNAVRITGFEVEDDGRAVAVPQPSRLWVNIGDSILSGDAALVPANGGRPADNAWAACTDARASYGYLLARHYGHAESRIAYGGYAYDGGLANLPALTTLIEQTTSQTSRLRDGRLQPAPDVVLINLGENGAPRLTSVTDALAGLRLRGGPAAKIVVMTPLSGKARAEVTAAFHAYRDASRDGAVRLVDLGDIRYELADNGHPTAAGHRAIYERALPAFDDALR